jgi:hypothetical protein
MNKNASGGSLGKSSRKIKSSTSAIKPTKLMLLKEAMGNFKGNLKDSSLGKSKGNPK